MDRKIIEMLVNGRGVNEIARSLRVSKRRIRRLREAAEEYGYLSDEGKGNIPVPPYPQVLFPDSTDKRSLKTSPQFEHLEPHKLWIEERLRIGWHAVTVFEELPDEAKAVTRSSFYRFLNRHKLNRLGEDSRRVVPEIIHQPGEALLVDWGKLLDAIDPIIGKKKSVWIFTGILGYSRYLMVRLVWTNNVETTLEVLGSMFREIGGVPARITSDNPKCFALEASRYEPLLNPAYERFAAHFGTTIECLPPLDPQKKGKVERPISYIRRLYEAHGPAWLGIEEAQAYMDKKLQIANERRHGTTLKRPREVFQEQEKCALKPLPALSYEIEKYHVGWVRQDGHVRFDNKYYSLDEAYQGKEVVVLGDSKTVSIYDQGKLLEVHPRITDPHQSKSTKPQHLKPWEQAMREDSIYRARAAKLGPSVEAMILALLNRGQGFIDTRKIWGILSLDKNYSAEQINAACERSLQLGHLGYRSVKMLLEAQANQGTFETAVPVLPVPKVPASLHRFVRPIEAYLEQLPLLSFSDQEEKKEEQVA